MATRKTKKAPQIGVGHFVRFLKYADDTPESAALLKPGVVYKVLSVQEADGDLQELTLELDDGKQTNAYSDEVEYLGETNPDAAGAASESGEEAAAVGGVPEVGGIVRFLGASDPESGDISTRLKTGAEFVVIEYRPDTSEEAQEGEYSVVISAPNPDFDPGKRPSKSNPANVQVELFDDEVEYLGMPKEEKAADEKPAAAAGKPAAKGKAATKAAAPKEEAEKPAPKPAAKTKAEAPKPATKSAAKPATKSATKAEQAPVQKDADGEIVLDASQEDSEVLAMVAEHEGNLIQLAQDLEQRNSKGEYHLGGVLYHLRRTGEYKLATDPDTGEVIAEYSERGGFEKFLQDHFNIGYRHAMYLIEIYKAFTLARIEKPAEVVAQIGWSKAREIARVLPDADENTSADLVELAVTSTYKDVKQAISEQLSTTGGVMTGGLKVTKVSMNFRLHDDDGKFVAGIIQRIREQNGLEDDNQALLFMAKDWYEQNVAEAAEAKTKDAAEEKAKPARGRRKESE